jgi:hypothetical protein
MTDHKKRPLNNEFGGESGKVRYVRVICKIKSRNSISPFHVSRPSVCLCHSIYPGSSLSGESSVFHNKLGRTPRHHMQF